MFVDYREFGDHSSGYRNLYEAALDACQRHPGKLVVEVGVREGGSLMTIIQAVSDAGNLNFVHSIDPFGRKPYKSRDKFVHGMYSDLNYSQMLRNVTPIATDLGVGWTHWKVLSYDWMEVFPVLEFWDNAGIQKPEFAFVHLDGDHDNDTVRDEIDWFYPRTEGMIVVDDAEQVDVALVCGDRPYEVRDGRIWLSILS